MQPQYPRRTVISGLMAASVLPIRPLLAQTDGFKVLRARETGYEGAVPGPILRARRGEEVKVRLVNETSAATAIHWHGVRVPNAMDGTSLTQDPVAPGAHFDYRFVPPDAGTFWYRASPRTPQNRTLHGFLIVQETAPPRVDADVAVLIGSTDETITANGVAPLDIAVWPKHRLRLRLLNTTGRFVTLRIDDHPMHVVAIDGQPAEPFRSRNSQITLSPGNRADVFVDAVMKPDSVAPIVLRKDDADVPLARLVYGNGIVPPGATMPDGYAGETIAPLPPNPLPERMDFRGALRIELNPNAGNVGVLAKPLFSAKRGRTVQLAIKNAAAHSSVLHIHGHHVRLLDALDDGWKPFWLDTILCVPQATTRVAFVADNPGKWLLDSRRVGGEAQSLEWFEVT
jgi:FtsP/CotA-like multicopper oxidase with cupredoxin domain